MRLEEISNLEGILKYLKELSAKKLLVTSSNLKITVVSPFVKDEFLEKLFELVPSNQILIVTDKRSELDIEEIVKKFPTVKMRFAERPDGIVHTKLFLLDWEDGDKVLLWGSANATLAGLNKNAESISWCKIPADVENGQKILSYFEQLWQKEPKGHEKSKEPGKPVESHIAHLGDIRLLLPSFSLVKQQDSFDKWLEEGKLFDPDKYKTTLPDNVKEVRLQIPLKKDIKIKVLAKQHDFNCSERTTLSYNKFKDVPNVDLPSIKDYAVNTMYGYWIPNQVVIWFGNKSPKSEIRMLMEGKIEALIGYIETKGEELIAIFMKKLDTLVEDKQVKGSLTDYFEDKYLSDHGNKLNKEFIKGELNDQLNKHIQACEKIREQPLETHDLFPVRFYLTQWDKFAVSFVRSIREFSESDNKKNGYRLGKIFINKTEGDEQQVSSESGITIDWKSVQKNTEILEKLRKGDWSVYRKSIHEAMEQELKQKLSNSKKKDTTSDTGQSQNNLI